MSTAQVAPPQLPAPRDYSEFARDWTHYMKWCIRRNGIRDNDVEDVLQEVFFHFVDRDALAHYDPSIASFKTFVSTYIWKRCHSFRRGVTRMDSALAVSPDLTTEDGTSLHEIHFGESDPLLDWVLSGVELKGFLSLILERDDDLSEVLRHVWDQAMTQDFINHRAIASDMGKSEGYVRELLKNLRFRAEAYGLLG